MTAWVWTEWRSVVLWQVARLWAAYAFVGVVLGDMAHHPHLYTATLYARSGCLTVKVDGRRRRPWVPWGRGQTSSSLRRMGSVRTLSREMATAGGPLPTSTG